MNSNMSVEGSQDLTPKARVAIILASASTLFVIAPFFIGTVVLAALGVYQAPWPAVIVVVSWVFTATFYTCMGPEFANERATYVTFDWAVSVVLLALLVGTHPAVAGEHIQEFAGLLYFSTLAQFLCHYFIAMWKFLQLNGTSREGSTETKPTEPVPSPA